MTERIELYKIRTFNELINAIFAFIRQEYRLLGSSLFKFAGPFILIYAVGSSIYLHSQLSKTDGSFFANFFSWTYFFNILSLIFAITAIRTVIYSYLKLYANSEGEELNVENISYLFRKNFMRLLLASFPIILLLSVGFILLIVPFFWLYIGLIFVFFVMIYEEQPFGSALNRSFDLISNNWWISFGFILVIYLLTSLSSNVFQIPQQILSTVFALNAVSGKENELFKMILVIYTGFSVFFSTAIGSLVDIGIGFQYFNIISKKENPMLAQRILKLYEDENLAATI